MRRFSIQAAREQGVFESSGVAIAWADLRTGRIIRANPQYVKFTGYSEAELTSKRFDDMAIPEEREMSTPPRSKRSSPARSPS